MCGHFESQTTGGRKVPQRVVRSAHEVTHLAFLFDVARGGAEQRGGIRRFFEIGHGAGDGLRRSAVCVQARENRASAAHGVFPSQFNRLAQLSVSPPRLVLVWREDGETENGIRIIGNEFYVIQLRQPHATRLFAKWNLDERPGPIERVSRVDRVIQSVERDDTE